MAFDWIAVVCLSERITGGALHSEDSKNVACFDFFNLLHIIGVHLYNSGHFNFLACFVIPHKFSSLQLPLIHSDVGQLPKTRLLQLKHVSYEGLLIIGGELYDLFFLILEQIAIVFLIKR